MTNDNFITPKCDYYKIIRHWDLLPLLDVCADYDNSKCVSYFDESDNALKQSWNLLEYNRTIVFCNPPHSKTKQFFLKAIEEATKNEVVIIMLIPLNSLGTKYYDQFKDYCIEYKLQRINFLDPITRKPSKFNSRNSYVSLLICRENLLTNRLINVEKDHRLCLLRNSIKTFINNSH